MNTFRSVVLVVDGEEDFKFSLDVNKLLTGRGSDEDYEIIIVVRQDPSDLTNFVDGFERIFSNVRVIFLSGQRISKTGALWAGIESAIGDRVTVVFEKPEDINDFNSFWMNATKFDVYFGYPKTPSAGRSWFQRTLALIFSFIYRHSTGASVDRRTFGIIDMNRQYVNFLGKTGQPEIALRNSNLFSGFSRSSQLVSSLVSVGRRKTADLFGRGLEILFSASSAPLRSMSFLALAGAALNVIYSAYVLLWSITGTALEGWTSMSLQMSGMFFIVSLLLAMICEFLIFMYQSQVKGSPYFIVREISSPRLGLNSKLNISEY